MNFKYILIIATVLIMILFGTACIYFLNRTNLVLPPGEPKITACTMEAKICPDGSAVGRTGKNCEFADCPVLTLSGITGIAMLGPMCPVQKNPPDPNCADRPYKTSLVATTSDQLQIVKQFNSEADGKFSVDLAPGEYVITSANTAGIFSHCSSNGLVKVDKNKYTDITVYCDTGIR